jgi:2-keto-4-pentenoate hydratase
MDGPEDLARALVEARETLVPVPRVAGLEKPAAAVVKSHAWDLLSRRGADPVVGYKVSMTRAWGAFRARDVVPSGSTLSRSTLFDPVIETEAVIHLTEDVSAGSTLADVMRQARVSAGIEIADSRWRGWPPRHSDPTQLGIPGPAESEADNALSSWMVLQESTMEAESAGLPLAEVASVDDGLEVASGPLTAVIEGHPAQVVVWLAHRLAEVGERLRAGQFVTTGVPHHHILTVPADGGAYEARLAGVEPARVVFSA